MSEHIRKLIAIDMMDQIMSTWFDDFGGYICKSKSERNTINRLKLYTKATSLIVHDRIITQDARGVE